MASMEKAEKNFQMLVDKQANGNPIRVDWNKSAFKRTKKVYWGYYNPDLDVPNPIRKIQPDKGN